MTDYIVTYQTTGAYRWHGECFDTVTGTTVARYAGQSKAVVRPWCLAHCLATDGQVADAREKE